MAKDDQQHSLRVLWREDGHEIKPHESLLRFEVADSNRVIGRSVADSPAYGHLCGRLRLEPGSDILLLSCFAVTNAWSLDVLGQLDPRPYRLILVQRLVANGYRIIPTRVFQGDIEAAAGEVHFDIVVMAGNNLHLEEFSIRRQRPDARRRLAPWFERLLNLFNPPTPRVAGSGVVLPRRMEP